LRQIRKCPIERAQKAVGRRRSTAGMQLGILFVRYLICNGWLFHAVGAPPLPVARAGGGGSTALSSGPVPDWWAREDSEQPNQCVLISALLLTSTLTSLAARSSAPSSPRLFQLPEHPAPTFAPSDMALSLSAHRATPGTRSLSGQSSPPAARWFVPDARSCSHHTSTHLPSVNASRTQRPPGTCGSLPCPGGMHLFAMHRRGSLFSISRAAALT
jgi:hypothetical protein